MNVKLIRMWSGEDVIADLIEDGTDVITIQNPIVGVPTGQGNIGFAPWSPLFKGKNEDINVAKGYVVYIAETQPEIEEQYTEMFSIIKSPSKKLIV